MVGCEAWSAKHTLGRMIFALPRRSVAPAALVVGTALVSLLVPLPGSLSVVATRWLSALGSAFAHVELVSEVGLIVLALGTPVALLAIWHRHPASRLPTSAAAIGVVVAYGMSEGLKVLFAQERPCARWPGVVECPPPGDWSLPSNHATLAFGAVVVIMIATRRTWVVWLAVATAVLVAGGRVAQGVHYLHDVALGSLLGILVPVALVFVAAALETYLKRRLPESRQASGS